jgi:hypothetical protein
MKLEQEVRHNSEDVDDKVLLDVVRALRRRVRVVSREYDVPYIAGSARTGTPFSSTGISRIRSAG